MFPEYRKTLLQTFLSQCLCIQAGSCAGRVSEIYSPGGQQCSLGKLGNRLENSIEISLGDFLGHFDVVWRVSIIAPNEGRAFKIVLRTE